VIGDVRHVIAHITRPITVRVGLILIGHLGAVILAVDDPVIVAVRTTEILVTGVALTIVVTVRLISVLDLGAVIDVIGDPIAVAVTRRTRILITSITAPVHIAVLLARVRREVAVIIAV
jgi:hypothetical protein